MDRKKKSGKSHRIDFTEVNRQLHLPDEEEAPDEREEL